MKFKTSDFGKRCVQGLKVAIKALPLVAGIAACGPGQDFIINVETISEHFTDPNSRLLTGIGDSTVFLRPDSCIQAGGDFSMVNLKADVRLPFIVGTLKTGDDGNQVCEKIYFVTITPKQRFSVTDGKHVTYFIFHQTTGSTLVVTRTDENLKTDQFPLEIAVMDRTGFQ